MDQDPCVGNIGWSVLEGAAADSTLAGVLAGFLIVAATSLLVQWNDRSDSDTFALFASGIPALTLSSYLFSVLSGTKPPTKPDILIVSPGTKPGFFSVVSGTKPETHPDPHVCGPVWSQWLPAFALLLIGAAVLLCGLGWALVSYSDNLAVKLIENNQPMKKVEHRRRFFINLSGWLSLGGTAAMACWLIAANVIYLKANTGTVVDGETKYLPFEFLHTKWYPMFFVFLFGLYVVVRSTYLITSRTRAARRENIASCIRYAPGVYESHTPPEVREGKHVTRVAREICAAAVIAIGTLLADYLTNQAVNEKSSGATAWHIGIVVVIYVIARLTYRGVVHFFGSTFVPERRAPSFDEADVKIRQTPSTEKLEDAIRIKYSPIRLSATSYHVAFLAILGTVFAAALTQGQLLPPWRIGLSLLVGGLYPAGMLLGLSYAVPAGPDTKLPDWKTWPGFRVLP